MKLRLLRRILRFTRVGGLVAILLGPSLFGQSLISLGTLGGSQSQAYAVNNAGQVTGDSLTAIGTTHAFLYSNGTMNDLGTLGGSGSFGRAINGSGQVAGFSNLAGDGTSHAFLFSNGGTSDLGSLGNIAEWPDYSEGYGINSAGQVTGFSYSAITPSNNGDSHAFVYDRGSMNDIGTLGGPGGGRSTGRDINASGQITGDVYNGITMSRAHAFIYTNGAMTELGTLGGNLSSGRAINDAGEVAGASRTSAGQAHAFAYANGTMRDLGTLGGDLDLDFSAANDINNLGLIVGTSITADHEQHAFIYVGGVMNDLNTLYASYLSDGISPGFAYLVEATSISDSGFITGYGLYRSETELTYQAFLLDTRSVSSSVPEAGNTLGALGLALAGAIALRRKFSRG